MKMFALVGRSNSGKTTLLEKMLAKYNEAGVRVATIKSIIREFDIDSPGKDTYRHRAAGAKANAITNGKKFAIVSFIENNESPADIAYKYFEDFDLVIIEGYKEGDVGKIELIGDSAEPPLFASGVSNIRMVVTDRDDIDASPLPMFKRDNVDEIMAAVEEIFLRS